MRKRTLLAAVAGAAAASAIAGGIAYATIPNGNVFSACMLNKVGTIRLIDKSLPASNLMSHCTSLETEVSWNQKGEQGIQGIQGPAGTNGTNGARGPTGADGQRGLAGATGPTGAKGTDGAPGARGTTGQQGATGADGAPGAAGPPGGLSGYEIVQTSTTFAPGESGAAQARCPQGKAALGNADAFRDGSRVDGSFGVDFVSTPGGYKQAYVYYIVPITNSSSSPVTVFVNIVCATVA